jgi:hypothetical protein
MTIKSFLMERLLSGGYHIRFARGIPIKPAHGTKEKSLILESLFGFHRQRWRQPG